MRIDRRIDVTQLADRKVTIWVDETSGGRTSLPCRLSRSVIDSVGPAGAEFARDADLVRPQDRPGQHDGLRADVPVL